MSEIKSSALLICNQGLRCFPFAIESEVTNRSRFDCFTLQAVVVPGTGGAGAGAGAAGGSSLFPSTSCYKNLADHFLPAPIA